MINVLSRIFCFYVLEIFISIFKILPFETESQVKNLHFAKWKHLEINRPPPPPPKGGQVGDDIGVGAIAL